MTEKIIYPLKVLSTGSYVPDRILTNEYFEKLNIGTNNEWITKNLGIYERRIANEDQCTSDLASKAAIDAITKSNITVNDIDLIIVATATPDRLAPSTACIVQEKIKAWNAAAFDLSAVCSGFMFSMSVAAQYLKSNSYKNILVIGADTFSKFTNYRKRDSVFFGDGAGAVIFQKAKESGILSIKIHSDGRGKNHFTFPAGGSETPPSTKTLDDENHYYEMNGKAVFNEATTVLPGLIKDVLETSSCSIDDIDLFVPHQPSIVTLEKLSEIIGLDRSKLMTNMGHYANTAGATLPFLLDQLNSSKKIVKGNKILMATIGSGWTYGAAVMVW